MSSSPLIVGLGGTPRADSTTERCLRLALDRAQNLGCRTRMISGPTLPTDIYEFDPAVRTPEAAALIQALRDADGLILASPSYHGSISGLLKNALDYAEDLRQDSRVYLQDRAVGCIVCAEGAQALGSTLMAMRSVVHALRGWPTPFGAAVHTAVRPFDAEGRVVDEAVRRACETVAEEVVTFARRWTA
jgi:FMN reductase